MSSSEDFNFFDWTDRWQTTEDRPQHQTVLIMFLRFRKPLHSYTKGMCHSSTRPGTSLHVTQFYQASPHISTASDKHWGERPGYEATYHLYAFAPRLSGLVQCTYSYKANHHLWHHAQAMGGAWEWGYATESTCFESCLECPGLSLHCLHALLNPALHQQPVVWCTHSSDEESTDNVTSHYTPPEGYSPR